MGDRDDLEDAPVREEEALLARDEGLDDEGLRVVVRPRDELDDGAAVAEVVRLHDGAPDLLGEAQLLAPHLEDGREEVDDRGGEGRPAVPNRIGVERMA